MNDSLAAVRDHVRDRMAAVHMTVTAEEITTRGTRRRTHRRVAGVAAACAVGAAVAGIAALGPASQPGVHVHLAAWSVDSNPDGTVTLTVREITHTDELRAALAQAGVPAIVTPGESCLNPENQSRLFHSAVLGSDALTIRPSAIPHGDKLLISQPTGPDGKVIGYGWGMVRAGEPLHCTDMSHITITPKN
ncbi:hypothetical protein [Rugosimonospora africana]|uniref:Uncharacterized protein n=1 Tax=Rugosimonospora africana TaxID=556532 RepID=A0A8J3R3B6_9ACTN|nr:hypothetical protein [Rugosimonospora africana]GIH21511.1 hypothetical protein Raf01_96830 [Rugosimonospora africana]